jgi:DNA/RNA-binding domain of Phe-tRNA-synthetase-like protein
MYFVHTPAIWREHTELVAGLLHAGGITPGADVGPQVARFEAIARERLATTPEGELPEIQAWRRAFSRMGLKPTQYRCASESLLRRFRKEGSLPSIHPLIDLCNAVSIAFASPIGVLDVARIAGGIEVRQAIGNEVYDAFSGETEQPDAGETIFADEDGRAHARRWTHRQSAYSAISEHTREILVVAEAMHTTARDDVPRLLEALGAALTEVWGAPAQSTTTILSMSQPRFEFAAQVLPRTTSS